MRLRVLRPVGERIILRRNRGAGLASSGYAERVIYTDSGTSALALVLAAIAARTGGAARGACQVLLPAYACPDVVSAVVHAGLHPRLVDLAKDSPFPSVSNWMAAIDGKTMAVVSVGVLGLRDPFTPAQATAAGLQAGAFIEDCCQVHPMAVSHEPDRNVVFSFGRGKPVSMLHGGAAVLLPENLRSVSKPDAGSTDWVACVRTALSAKAYNLLSQPRLYGWISRVPGFRVGMTSYAELSRIGAMNEHVRDCLDPAAGWNDPHRRNLQALIRELLRSTGARGVEVDLWQRYGDENSWLLRYPLLLRDRVLRDDALARLNEHGLGASGMYMHCLPEIPGIPKVGLHDSMENAKSFAGRLLTLPLHGDVTDADAGQMCRILGEVAAR